jgi:hypothetical protein
MAWLSRNDWTASDRLYNDQLNSLANDLRNWGGDVNGGAHHLYNVILDGAGNFTETLSPITVAPGVDGQSSVVLTQETAPATFTPRWSLSKNADPETGSNTGSDFAIARYDDAGNVIDYPITIRRSDGLITMGSQKWTGPIDGGGQTLTNVNLSGVTGVLADPTLYTGDLIVRGATAPPTRLGVGADGQVLTADSTALPLGVKWAAPTGGLSDPTTTKGDLIVRGSSPPATRLAVGSNGQVLTVDSSQPLGVKWAAGGGGGALTQVYDEPPSGSIDGLNIVFTVLNAPNPPASLDLFLNGVEQRVSIDYTLTGNSIQFTIPPRPADNMYADYTH